MPQYHAIGDALVTSTELTEKAPELEALSDAMVGGSSMEALRPEPGKKLREAFAPTGTAASAPEVRFTTGVANAKNVLTSMREGPGSVPFTPVDIGKPLAVEIRHVYTGRYPRRVLFDNGKDLLVTSAMKGISVQGGAPRAVNVLRQDVEKHSYVVPRATDNGTPLVFYTPALTVAASLLTIEMVFDEFPQQAIQALGGAIGSAASIPVFVPHAAYLLAASTLVKLAAKAGESVFDGRPFFSTTVELGFRRPGAAAPIADFRLLTDEDLDPQTLKDYRVGPTGRLVHVESGAEYKGDEPYVVISLDGAEVKEYESFAPTAATAVLLDRFFGIREGKEQPVDMLVDALKLYNDFQYRTKADAARKQLSELKEGTPEYDQAKKEYDALVKNITSDVLKPA